jgi:hypothetical protein
MSASEPSRQCPRCGTLLFEDMPFCRACGWQFAPAASGMAASSAPPSEYIPFDGADLADELPMGQPDFPPQQPSGYFVPNQISYGPATQLAWPPPLPSGYVPLNQTSPAGYMPAPVVAAPARRGKTLLLIGVIVLLLVAAAGGILLHLHSTMSTSTTPIFDRHGLQGDVPLPDNTAFQYKHTVTQGTLTADEWIWKVNKSEPASIQEFYQTHLPQNGWTHIQTIQGDTLGVVGCKSEQVLVIGISKHLHDSDSSGTSTITDAPTGGSALGIALTSNQALMQSFCDSTQP